MTRNRKVTLAVLAAGMLVGTLSVAGLTSLAASGADPASGRSASANATSASEPREARSVVRVYEMDLPVTSGADVVPVVEAE